MSRTASQLRTRAVTRRKPEPLRPTFILKVEGPAMASAFAGP
jgi:hypothetical protein